MVTAILCLIFYDTVRLIRPDDSPVGQQMRTLIEMMTEEAIQNAMGVTAILDRLSDALFLYVIRHALHHDPKLSPLLAALSDEHLRPAVSAFIDAPAESWTVDRLAALVFQSRSTFSERFSLLVGMSPMEFVTAWRMQLATAMLVHEQVTMLDIALRCGYESEAAFRKAFKRVIGVTPGKVRG